MAFLCAEKDESAKKCLKTLKRSCYMMSLLSCGLDTLGIYVVLGKFVTALCYTLLCAPAEMC